METFLERSSSGWSRAPRRRKAAGWAVVGSLLVAGTAIAAQPSITPEAARAIFARIRAAAGAKGVTIPEAAELDQPDPPVLLTALYRRGPTTFHAAVSAATLRAAAEEAGRRLAEHLAPLPDGTAALEQGRLQFDLVARREPINPRNRIFALQGFKPGMDGLACYWEGGSEYFSPLAVLREIREADPVRTLFISRTSSIPPRRLRFERLRTIAFVEERPGGRALPIMRGNVLIADPHPSDMIAACCEAGLWLLRMQQEDGSFLPTYFPGQERADEAQTSALSDEMRAVVALTVLHRLTGDERFLRARDRAIALARNYQKTHERLGAAYLGRGQKDDLTATATLLTALCTHELSQAAPAADHLMRSLGEYLCIMTDAEGRLYTGFDRALEDHPTRVVQGQPYADVLMALCLLEQVSPNRRVRQTIERLVGQMTSFRSSAPPAGPRTIEALAEAYKLMPGKRLGNIVYELGVLLTRTQVTPEKANLSDEIGGFAEPGMIPQTDATAMAATALAVAYQMGWVVERDPERFREPIRRAAEFLLNMQFRKVNSFYLRRPEVILGGFRSRADDLTLELGPAAEAVRALIAAATVLSEPAPPKTASPAAGGD